MAERDEQSYGYLHFDGVLNVPYDSVVVVSDDVYG